MTRRSFLGALAAALVLDPEKALWLPGRKLVSIPKRRKRVNRLLTSDMILDAALERFAAESVVMQLSNDRYTAEFDKKIGMKLQIRQPFITPGYRYRG